MEWLKKWLTDGFTKVPLLSISINLKFFKKYGSRNILVLVELISYSRMIGILKEQWKICVNI